MTHENVWRAAAYMISEFGGNASQEALRYADKLLELGDPDGYRTWAEVAEAVKTLHLPATGEAKN
jgi:hypothetical protein